jgi:hypothetical protein
VKKILVCFICLTFLIVGCGGYHVNNATSRPDSVYAEPNIIEYKGSRDDGYFYIVDKNTNTVYMIYNGYRQFGLTDAVWPDGKPVTVEELEHNFKR